MKLAMCAQDITGHCEKQVIDSRYIDSRYKQDIEIMQKTDNIVRTYSTMDLANKLNYLSLPKKPSPISRRVITFIKNLHQL